MDRIVEFVVGLIGLPGAAVDQHAQVARLPDGQMLREGAVRLPTGVCEFLIYSPFIYHPPFSYADALLWHQQEKVAILEAIS